MTLPLYIAVERNVYGVAVEGCDPWLNPGKLREHVEILKYQLAKK